MWFKKKKCCARCAITKTLYDEIQKSREYIDKRYRQVEEMENTIFLQKLEQYKHLLKPY
jgi:hypothetical protein